MSVCSVSPGSPTSRRGSWLDAPVGSTPSSRQASLIDLSSNKIEVPIVAAAAAAAVSSITVATLMSNLAKSPPNSRLNLQPSSLSMKRKFDSDSPLMPFRKASAADIQLPSDPTRRASILNLASAAAAAVLQSQERRMSTLADPESKRQRVQQLDMLYEQARSASVASNSLNTDSAAPSDNLSDNVSSSLATTLGITPKGSPRITAMSPSTPKRQLITSTKADVSPSPPLPPADEPTEPSVRVPPSPLASRTDRPTLAAPSSPSTVRTSPKRLTLAVDSGEALLASAKEAAEHYSRFYKFESQWAKKALELEQRRASVRIDPLSESLPPLTSSDKLSRASSPSRQSAPVSRIASRGTSPSPPTGMNAPARNSAAPGLTALRGSSVGGLASVLSDFAELIEHRQRSCSGLEALAKQAKEMPKRLSQPNPQFRTSFGDFSWSKRLQTPLSSSTVSRASESLTEVPGETDTPAEKDTDLENLKTEVVKAEAATQLPEPQPSTPRSTMSIASML